MTWLLRIAMILLIGLSVAWKTAVAQRPGRTSETAEQIGAILDGHLGGRVTGQAWSPSISIFSAPLAGCSAPMTVVTAPPDFSAASILLQMQRPGDHHLFAYRDWISPRPDRWAVLRSQIWRKALSVMGLSRASNADKLLFIAEPPGCAVAETAPWRRFWEPAR
ncbi:MAG: hypothetical protein JO303_18130 [Caulobacteraceae bacterium]|nr:hypothetical protein [Caulobacteraceae bacterium]